MEKISGLVVITSADTVRFGTAKIPHEVPFGVCIMEEVVGTITWDDYVFQVIGRLRHNVAGFCCWEVTQGCVVDVIFEP